MSTRVQPSPSSKLLERLADVVGADQVLTGEQTARYATDVYRTLESPLAVVSPGSVEQLQDTVRTATEAGIAVFVRGGGASYTDGYLPSRTDSILINMRRLNRIVEINERDAYVTVEAGATWRELKAALDPLGFRTPFFGPFSGSAATVGGSMSQHSISHGSGAHGISAQSLLALEVITASGGLLRTGAAARGTVPFARWYGPDLAGLFCGDCGALGVKARVTLPLLRRRPAFECLSFAFQTLPQLAEALREAALEHLDDEHFALDAAISQGQIARQERASLRWLVASVWRSAPSAAAAIRQLSRMAVAGATALRAAPYSTHFIVEGVRAKDARIKADRLRELMAAGGVEIPNTVPAIVRGMPFAPLYNALGPNGERWVPLHGCLPHSRVAQFHDSVETFFASKATEMKRLGVWRGGMFTTVGSSAFLYELALYWPGAPSAYHLDAIPGDYLAKLPKTHDCPQATELVEQMRRDLVGLYSKFSTTHFQVGKVYPYGSVLLPESLSLVRAIKRAVDPEGLMNPGALEL